MPKLPGLPFTLFLICVSIALLNCKAADKNTAAKPSLESVIKSTLGQKYNVDYNKAKSFALCQQQRADDHLQRIFSFIVVRLSDNVIVKEGTFKMGYVKWHDDKSIEILSSSLRDDNKNEKQIVTISSEQL